MKRAFILAALVLLAAASVFAQAKDQKSAGDAKVEQELREMVRAWDEATVKGDAGTLDRLLAQEFTFVGGPNKAEYLASIKNRPADLVVESAVSEGLEIQVYGETALVTGVDTIKSKSKGESKTYQWLFLDVWVRRGGRWQCVKTYSSLKRA